jgi:hypothetical protein
MPTPKPGLDSFDLEPPNSDSSAIQFIVSRRKSDRADVFPLVGAFPRVALRPLQNVPFGRPLSRGHMLGSAPALLQPHVDSFKAQAEIGRTFGAHGSEWTVSGQTVGMAPWAMPAVGSRNAWKNR